MRSLYSFQSEAIEQWERNDRVGILAMATGSGKTITAIRSIERLPNSIVCVIVVPSKLLVEQWYRELKIVFGHECKAIEVSSEDPNWYSKLKHLVDAALLNPDESTRNFIISTIQTARGEKFRRIISQLGPNRTAIVIDEVHHAGARKYSQVMLIKARFRLGLSATPERTWDDLGNQAIFDYFGPVIYEYSMTQAIHDGILSSYRYFIHLAYLNDDERRRFNQVSTKIARILSNILGEYPELKDKSISEIFERLQRLDPGATVILRTLYLRRISILKSAKNKGEILRQIVKKNSLGRCLVYCNDLEHLRECNAILHNEGYVAQEYSSDISANMRSQILQSFGTDNSENRFLLSVHCLDEGVDIPTLDSAILVASSRSTREFIQRRGRILRKSPTKTTSTIHDIVILPVRQDESVYSLPQHERQFVRNELERVSLFAKSSENVDDIQTNLFLRKFGPLMNEIL